MIEYLKNDKYPNLSNSNKLHNLSFYFGNNPELTKNELNKIARMFNGIS